MCPLPRRELPPVNGFWSLTLQFNDDGSLTLYAGAASGENTHHSTSAKSAVASQVTRNGGCLLTAGERW